MNAGGRCEARSSGIFSRWSSNETPYRYFGKNEGNGELRKLHIAILMKSKVLDGNMPK